MNVFYYGIKENDGGLENFAKNLIQSVSRQDKNIKYTLIVEHENFSFRDLFETIGCNVIVLPNAKKHPFSFYRKLTRVFKSANKDDSIIQLNVCSYRNLHLFKACKKSKIKTVIVGHYTKIEGKFGFLHYLGRRLYSKFALNVTISEEVTNFMFPKHNNLLLIDNGIQCDRFSYSKEKRNEIRKRLNVDDDCFLIGQIGRVSPEKNQLFAIKVFDEFKKRNDLKSKLYFVGKKMYDEPLKCASLSPNKKDIVFVEADNKEIEKFYSAFDCFILPSLHDASPLTLLECSSNGVRSIISDVVPKLKVNCPSNVFLPLDIEKWCSALCDNLALKNVERSNLLINSIYDIDVCAKAYLNIYYKYNDILEKSSKNN